MFELAEQVKKNALFLYNLSCCIDSCPFGTDCAGPNVRKRERYFRPSSYGTETSKFNYPLLFAASLTIAFDFCLPLVE